MMLTSTQIGELAAQFFIAGAGTLSFAVLFGCPRKSLFFCGLVGAVRRSSPSRIECWCCILPQANPAW